MSLEIGGSSRGSSASSAYKTWTLTPHGISRVDAIAGRGFEGRVLEAIRNSGCVTISGIVRETGLDFHTVKTQVEVAQKHGYIAATN